MNYDFLISIVKVIFAFMVMGIIMFSAYIFTRFISQKAQKTFKYMKVIESMPLGIDRAIHLIKIGDKFFVISTAGKQVSFLTEVNIENYSEEVIDPKLDFYNVIGKYFKKNENKEKKTNNRDRNKKEKFKTHLKDKMEKNENAKLTDVDVLLGMDDGVELSIKTVKGRGVKNSVSRLKNISEKMRTESRQKDEKG